MGRKGWKNGGLRGRPTLREKAGRGGGGGGSGGRRGGEARRVGAGGRTPTPAGGAGLMKSVCPVKVKINWRSGGGYRDNQPGPVVFKPTHCGSQFSFRELRSGNSSNGSS